MERLKKGDINAMDVIYDETHKLIYYHAYHILKDPYLTEDIVQETYLKIHADINIYQNQNPRAWIITIAKNLSLNLLKRESRTIVVDESSLDVIDSKQSDTPLIELANHLLDEEEFMILMYCVVEEQTRRKVGELLGLSTRGVTYKLNVALDKLRQYIKENNYDY
ncbi:MAG: RNA polymerase sigma factor [Acholeplasmataceae bacterium]